MPAPDVLVARLGRLIREAQADKHIPSVAAAALRDGEIVWSDVLGAWWSEGIEYVLRYRDGRLEGVARDEAAAEAVTHFARAGEGLYRAVDGLERGELLRIVRDSGGAVTRLELAGYPFERRPQSMAKPA